MKCQYDGTVCVGGYTYIYIYTISTICCVLSVYLMDLHDTIVYVKVAFFKFLPPRFDIDLHASYISVVDHLNIISVRGNKSNKEEE